MHIHIGPGHGHAHVLQMNLREISIYVIERRVCGKQRRCLIKIAAAGARIGLGEEEHTGGPQTIEEAEHRVGTS
jgi:hypothetical protein